MISLPIVCIQSHCSKHDERHLAVAAPQTFGDESFLDAAVRAGDLIWERGLLKKGHGLCHGTSGNAYALLRLWKATDDPKHLHRAAEMGLFIGSPEGRKLNDVPDHPLSLFEGRAGALCLLGDLLLPQGAVFPLYQCLGAP